MGERLAGKRAVVTCAGDYMGPAICTLFREEGADVVADERDLTDAAAPATLILEAGHVDILIANLSTPADLQPVVEIQDEAWVGAFDGMVHPLMRLVRAVLPQMMERRAGKIVAITSATPLRPIGPVSAYASARGAQHVFLQHAGLEAASHNVQINAVAQNFVKNPDYYPEDKVDGEGFQAFLKSLCPTERFAEGSESAELALFLASENSNFITGQIIPFAGGSAVNV
ncbi:MAG: SDR family oxidoreductase [Candidatus Binatia bacterium]|nr:SDR family oxidoreductase [Candidatus Binatia bacterium]